MEGTVVTIRSAIAEVDTNGQLYECQARRRLLDTDTEESKPIAVGDRVIFSVTAPGAGVIEDVLPRTTKLSRRSPRDVRIEHIIATNVDQLLIVSSVNLPPLSVGLIDRYIIAGHAGDLEPLLCINKIDLAEDESEYLPVAKTFRAMEYPVVLTSALQGTGIEELRGLLEGKSTVLAGHSGVGKSSLINAIQPGLKLRTSSVAWKGRHCTTSVSLLRLDVGGYVVDTPGIRELTLWDIEEQEVAQFFPNIWELSHECRLPDCIHIHEPGCAVKQALEAGELPPVRYDSYVRIVETIEQADVPRQTDVDQPSEQISKTQRRVSRRARRQNWRQMADAEMEGEEEEGDEDYGP
jgi:ribosome biogenesis GTPase